MRLPRRRCPGWTLVETLVSVSILTVLMLVLVRALGVTQRSLSSAIKVTQGAAGQEAALIALRQALPRIHLGSVSRFSEHGDTIGSSSDGHFVCGPATELLPDLPNVLGDAIFYQRINSGGLIECGGFFVQFRDADSSRPSLVAGGTPHRARFCLVHWHDSPDQLRLFVTGRAGVPIQNLLRERSDLYRWFRDGVSRPESCSVVAENVLALRLRTTPAQACYDTRRHQWEGESPAALASRHRLPAMLTVEVALIDESSWSRRAATVHGDATLARQWLQLQRASIAVGDDLKAEIAPRLPGLGLQGAFSQWTFRPGI